MKAYNVEISPQEFAQAMRDYVKSKTGLQTNNIAIVEQSQFGNAIIFATLYFADNDRVTITTQAQNGNVNLS